MDEKPFFPIHSTVDLSSSLYVNVYQRLDLHFPVVFPCFSYDIPMNSPSFPMVFLSNHWLHLMFHAFPMDIPMNSLWQLSTSPRILSGQTHHVIPQPVTNVVPGAVAVAPKPHTPHGLGPTATLAGLAMAWTEIFRENGTWDVRERMIFFEFMGFMMIYGMYGWMNVGCSESSWDFSWAFLGFQWDFIGILWCHVEFESNLSNKYEDYTLW